MIGREFRFHDGEKGAALAIRIKGRCKEREFKKVLKDGTVIVNLEGSGVDLNQELLEFLSNELEIDLKRLQIIAGHDGKSKLVSIVDMQPREIQKFILGKIN